MNLDINSIFNQKLAEIESRLSAIDPGLSGNNAETSDIPFEKYLSDASLLGLDNSLTGNDTSLYDYDTWSDLLNKAGNDEENSANLLRAQLALSKSTAYIPSDKTELMNLINASIDNAAQKYGVDRDLVRAVMKQESSFNPRSISSAGAQGLMQLMPGTADALNITNPFDIVQNINGGTQYLKDQLTRFNGDVGLALAAYNAGPNSVEKYGGIPPYTETQNYVQKVTEYYNQYKMLTSR
ncbi:MAG: soluble lytic murein transglycosylase-like protein [Eubacterium sp.]|jgi:soluble lytic murein transglycosylase-like protein|nr:soluble lytic murein transglycosylase-like protein [Eubacterium sp.]